MSGKILALLALCLLVPAALRADDIPAKPAQYFNDYANVVDQGTADAFNLQLANFDRATSNQFVVAIYPKLNTSDGLDDYCYRVAEAWGVGRKKINNGVVLFVFIADHKMRIQTGYGLEGALPDVTCDSILNDQMSPYFKRGDYAGGLRVGINSIIAATKGEYKGNGRTVQDENLQTQNVQESSSIGSVFFLFIFLLIFFISAFRRPRGVIYGSSGIGSYGGFFLGGGGGGFSSGGGGGGGGFSGGGGGFSGGGGSFGGGGASGSW